MKYITVRDYREQWKKTLAKEQENLNEKYLTQYRTALDIESNTQSLMFPFVDKDKIIIAPQ